MAWLLFNPRQLFFFAAAVKVGFVSVLLSQMHMKELNEPNERRTRGNVTSAFLANAKRTSRINVHNRLKC